MDREEKELLRSRRVGAILEASSSLTLRTLFEVSNNNDAPYLGDMYPVLIAALDYVDCYILDAHIYLFL